MTLASDHDEEVASQLALDLATLLVKVFEFTKATRSQSALSVLSTLPFPDVLSAVADNPCCEPEIYALIKGIVLSDEQTEELDHLNDKLTDIAFEIGVDEEDTDEVRDALDDGLIATDLIVGLRTMTAKALHLAGTTKRAEVLQILATQVDAAAIRNAVATNPCCPHRVLAEIARVE